jgi:hypothetical protein
VLLLEDLFVNKYDVIAPPSAAFGLFPNGIGLLLVNKMDSYHRWMEVVFQ